MGEANENRNNATNGSSLRKRKRFVYEKRVSLLAILAQLTLLPPTLVMWLGPEKTAVGVFNLYLPQIIWVVPLMLALPIILRYAPRKTLLLIPGLLWVLFVLMGFIIHWRVQSPRNGGRMIRVMSYNVKWGHRDTDAIAAEIKQDQPDIILMQDSQYILDGPVQQALKGYHFRQLYQIAIASRFPLSPMTAVKLHQPGTAYNCARALVTVGGRHVTLYSVHLLSPRVGLDEALQGDFHPLMQGAAIRLTQINKLIRLSRNEQNPLLIAGDLNSPPASEVMRKVRKAGFMDAFESRGVGYGYTYGQYLWPLRLPFLRLDHILLRGDWRVIHCWTGNSLGSGHSPVIADLWLPSKTVENRR